MDNKSVLETTCIDELLDTWEGCFPEDRHFNRDGIISEKDWNECDVKILFVLKETNKANQNIICAINSALITMKSGWWKGNVLRRVGSWAYGLQNYKGEVPPHKEAKFNCKKAIKNIAYINIRKTAGGVRTNKTTFDAHANEFAPFRRRQIELIKPDIVVLCGTYKQVKKHIFPELEKVSKQVHKHKEMLFINAYHPAARMNPSELYHQVVGCYYDYKGSRNF